MGRQVCRAVSDPVVTFDVACTVDGDWIVWGVNEDGSLNCLTVVEEGDE